MSVSDKIENIQNTYKSDIDSATNNPEKLKEIYIKFLGRKGLVADLYSELALLPNDQKPAFGQKINKLKISILY